MLPGLLFISFLRNDSDIYNYRAFRWRFEALKSRCIIANRESLLEDNKIPFGARISDIENRIRQIDNENVSPNIVCRPSMLGFKRRSISNSSSPRPNPSEKVEAVTANPIEAANVPKGTLRTTEPTSIVVKTEKDEPKNEKVVEKPAQQSRTYSGVTIRKKMNSSNTTLLDHSEDVVNHLQVPGTVVPTIIRPKVNLQSNSAGILKPSTSPNIPTTGKKVKFDAGPLAVNKIKEEPSTEPKSDNAPKTAIKKRIFISSSKKPTAK